jgi:hypothetical protein
MDPALANLLERKSTYRTKPVEVWVDFSNCDQMIETLEGPVVCHAGDAIVCGVRGERYPVPARQFRDRYKPVLKRSDQFEGSPLSKYFTKRMKKVAAAQLQEHIQLTLKDGRGTLNGQPGDWCVWYSPNDVAIIAREIFSELYEQDSYY